MNISGPSALLSLLIAFIIMILSGMHMNELISSMPKSCLLYNFTYANFGEIPAFLVGWISLLDFIICIIIVAKNWSNHMVLATVSIIMITICALATNSTAFVGFYFADPNNWLAAGFLKMALLVIRGASNYLCAYIGIEALSFYWKKRKIHADEYVMTIGCVCGLSGTMLAIFVPATRILALLCNDNLLPLNILAHTSKNVACLVYDQRYNPKIVGLFRETAFYHDIHRKRYKTQPLNICDNDNDNDDDDGDDGGDDDDDDDDNGDVDQYSCSASTSRYSTGDENSEMMSSYEILRNIMAQQEIHCQRLMEKVNQF
ncbi:hypothetical protein DINM_007185 [Dirofilaria immitis]|nr:hypothetical protein [Dirofilaria immitis]